MCKETDILLGGDNAVVIALACRNLEPKQRMQGILWGTAGAIVLRVVLIAFALTLLSIPDVYKRQQLADVLAGLGADKVLSAGIINGRNIWRTDLDAALSLIHICQNTGPAIAWQGDQSPGDQAQGRNLRRQSNGGGLTAS